jgi:hypothetical protein
MEKISDYLHLELEEKIVSLCELYYTEVSKLNI